MSIRIGGMGWVTPLGTGVPAVWQRLLSGDCAQPEQISSDLSPRAYPVLRVPTEALAGLPPHPRLRRSSAISRFAVLAGLGALEAAQITLDAETAARTAIIFTTSNGGVIYTKRFYQDIVASGAQAASPLLFPETVFNAPASHLAAILGITGATYTLVGDGAVGLLALKMAEDLMQNPALDRCLVVAAEEADWLLCDAYHRWRLLRARPPIEVFQSKPRGTILGEGAAAILVDRLGPIAFDEIDPGSNFQNQSNAASCLNDVLERLRASDADLIIVSANGTFIDQAERSSLCRHSPEALIYAPKVALGESIAAGGLGQVICAAEALKTQRIPNLPDASENTPSLPPSHQTLQITRAIVSVCGMNQQVAGLALKIASRSLQTDSPVL